MQYSGIKETQKSKGTSLKQTDNVKLELIDAA